MLNIEEINQCINENVPDVLAIYQFGSAGTEYERPDSDIDIAILPSKPISAKKRLALIRKLTSITDREQADVIDLSTTNIVLTFEIINSGKRIFCHNLTRCEVFESTEFSKYVRLNEARNGIIEDIKKRGSVYGR